MASGTRVVRCSFACSSTRMSVTPTRTTRFSPVMPLDLLIENRRAQDAIEDLQAARHPQRRIQAPIIPLASGGRAKPACARVWRC